MKKLTAGVFTVMLGLVAANADAAVTSKKYVDDAISGVNASITTNVNNLTEQITSVGGNVTTLQQTVTNLTAETGEGSIADKIATALEDYNTSDEVDAKVKKVSDALADEITARENADTAIEGKIGTLTDLTTSAQGSTVAAINELVTANKAQDDKIDANTNAIDEIKSGAALTDGAVTTDKIDNGAVTTDKIDNGAVTTEKLADVTTAGTGTKVTYNAKGQITGSAALTAADIPTLTADKISNLNKLASATLPESCNQPGADCVLKFNGTDYTWEDIADTYAAPTTGGNE